MLLAVKLIDAFICSTDSCNYSKVVENGNLEELYKLIEDDGGKITEFKQVCPNCRKNSLGYTNYPL